MFPIEATQKIKEYDQQENQVGGQINSTHRPSLNAFKSKFEFWFKYLQYLTTVNPLSNRGAKAEAK